jgi:hypothetical protein
MQFKKYLSVQKIQQGESMRAVLSKYVSLAVFVVFLYDALSINGKYNDESRFFSVIAKPIGFTRGGVDVILFDGHKKYSIRCEAAENLCEQAREDRESHYEVRMISTSILGGYFAIDAKKNGKLILSKESQDPFIKNTRNNYLLVALISFIVFLYFLIINSKRRNK